MSRPHRILCCALSVLIAALVLSGCNWTGEGKDVAAAILATKDVKTRAFIGSVKIDMTKMARGGANTGAPGTMTMTFSGAIDETDRAHPKMVMTMTAEGQTTKMVAPGDDKFYVTAAGQSWYVEAPAGQASRQTIDPQKIYAALGDAVSGFQKAPSITNANGASVNTISAKVSKSKLCGPVFDAFGEALDQAGGGLGGGLGGSGTGGTSPKLNRNGEKMMQNFCKMMLRHDPRVWFGIDGGRLTDVELTADITLPMAGQMGIEVQYHEYDQDKPQTGFEPPAGARPMSELGALPGAAGATAPTTVF